ncbi:hypothetical protein SB48_HM08orf06532 [Heyndrickxia coagulans]|uniref:Uncharacterized protein n=1 Tax=Heyndrickxia coagulans TaxID=1398 RepID=A0AAN0T9X4_HEYCO|nr:hypothetical protein SB48_HM08orf06532 [Heyndrickxia coagulans]
MTASKGHFEPGYSMFCLFDGFKKTFRTRMQRILSFWRFQKDILGPNATCFVLLTGSGPLKKSI